MMLPNFSIPLFGLANVDRYLIDYYMDREGNIYSTKSGLPVKLNGSYAPSGRYFTLNKRSFSHDRLKQMAKNHSKFMDETGKTCCAHPAPISSHTGRTKDPKAAVVSKGYVLATLNPKGKLVFGTEPMFHTSESTARAEAERVAAVSGGEIVLLQIVGKVKVQKAVWE